MSIRNLLQTSATLLSAAILIATGLAVLSALGLTAISSGASQSASIALLALDADSSGNAPRSVGSIEDCVSASIGQPVEIDIVAPSPGIPADRGVAAYQFSILYDPAVVWIDTDDSGMLLAQADGSNVIPIADPKPDRNGVYQSWGIDFGSSGIEPVGSSEIGPGVIARMTLLPQSEGVSTLTLSNVLIIDDVSQRITIESIQSGTIHVGEPCAEPSPNTIPSSDNGDSGDSSESNSDVAAATSAPSPAPASEVPTAGGPPPSTGGTFPWLVLSGLIAALAGAGLLAGTSICRTRRDVPAQQDRARHC